MQIYGGHGYIRENGVEQFVRDARITQIYEGTNGIQALDLVGRKLPMKGGQAAQRLLGEMSAFIAEHKADDKMKEFVEPLEKALGRVQDAALFLMQNAMKNPDEAGAAATDLLRLFGLTALAFVRAAAAGDHRGGDQELIQPRRGRRRGERVSAPVRADGTGVPVGADGGDQPRQDELRRGCVLHGQACDRALLHAEAVAADRSAVARPSWPLKSR